MRDVATCLMFVGEMCGKAEEAATLYVSLFNDAGVLGVEGFEDSGVRRVKFRLGAREFVAMDSDAPHPFTFTPAMSLFVDCDSEEELARVYDGLSDGAAILMPLDAYPFSEKFAWLNDRYGVSWQLNLGSVKAP